MRIQYLFAILLGLTALDAYAKKSEDLLLESGELDRIINQINSKLRSDPWNEEIFKTSSLKHFVFEKHYVDVVTIEYLPYSQLNNVKKNVKVECTRYVEDIEWECSKSLIRNVYSPSLSSWVFLLSEDVDEDEAVKYVQVLGNTTKLIWKEKDFETTIQSFGDFALDISFTGENFKIYGTHEILGSMTIELPRHIQGPEVEMLDAVQFFRLCDNLEMKYGPNPCEQDES